MFTNGIQMAFWKNASYVAIDILNDSCGPRLIAVVANDLSVSQCKQSFLKAYVFFISIEIVEQFTCHVYDMNEDDGHHVTSVRSYLATETTFGNITLSQSHHKDGMNHVNYIETPEKLIQYGNLKRNKKFSIAQRFISFENKPLLIRKNPAPLETQ